VVGERCVFEFCGGAGGVSDFGEPGPGRGHGGVRAVVDAHDRRGVRGGAAGGAHWAGAFIAGITEPGGVVRRADDRSYGGVAACREPEDGGAASADGLDRGDRGSESIARGICEAASPFGFAGKRSIIGGIAWYVLHGE